MACVHPALDTEHRYTTVPCASLATILHHLIANVQVFHGSSWFSWQVTQLHTPDNAWGWPVSFAALRQWFAYEIRQPCRITTLLFVFSSRWKTSRCTTKVTNGFVGPEPCWYSLFLSHHSRPPVSAPFYPCSRETRFTMSLDRRAVLSLAPY